jgi:hypothetical protein
MGHCIIFMGIMEGVLQCSAVTRPASALEAEEDPCYHIRVSNVFTHHQNLHLEWKLQA